MKDRPILFSGPMVRALLAGTKTQTRRIVKPQPNDPTHYRIVNEGSVHYTRPDGDPLIVEAKATPGYQVMTCTEWLASQRNPYGQPGDRLWVREAWAETHVLGMPAAVTVFRAYDTMTDYGGPWKPGIHMHRWRSRLDLEITAVRVERLQDISESDAKAEGIQAIDGAGWHNYLWHGNPDAPAAAVAGWSHQYSNYLTDPVGSYSSLWESINGSGSWGANPWVWVVEFKRITP